MEFAKVEHHKRTRDDGRKVAEKCHKESKEHCVPSDHVIPHCRCPKNGLREEQAKRDCKKVDVRKDCKNRVVMREAKSAMQDRELSRLKRCCKSETYRPVTQCMMEAILPVVYTKDRKSLTDCMCKTCINMYEINTRNLPVNRMSCDRSTMSVDQFGNECCDYKINPSALKKEEFALGSYGGCYSEGSCYRDFKYKVPAKECFTKTWPPGATSCDCILENRCKWQRNLEKRDEKVLSAHSLPGPPSYDPICCGMEDMELMGR